MTVPLSEAKTRLDELIAQLRPGEELVLTDDANHPVARLVGEAARGSLPAHHIRDFVKLRHYAAVPVCVAAAGLTSAGFGLAGAEPWAGFVSGLLGSVLALSVTFALAYAEVD